MTKPQNWHRIPQELKALNQWCIAGPDRSPYTITQDGIVRASSTDPRTWRSFEEITTVARQLEGADIGFMLSDSDPYTCVDMDVVNAETQRRKNRPHDPTKWTTSEEFSRYQKIKDTLASYTEISSSGFGLHIWVKAAIGAGVRRQGVEVYCRDRFIVCTGNVLADAPIHDRQELIDLLVDEMRGPGYDGPVTLVEVEEEDSDMEVYERATNASNAEKFNKLFAGDWHGDYPSQSEADLSLMSMLAFYSKSNEQCRRIFRCSGLGQRDKATKNDRYLNYTLEVIRSRQMRENKMADAQRAMAADLVREMQGSTYADVVNGQLAASEIAPPKTGIHSSIDWPPGLAGAIAGFIYNSSPRPVKEVAIVAALGFLAGVCGKAYNIPQSGLNAYIVLVARSGVGKEAMHGGLALICEEMRKSIPAAMKFVSFDDFASGPALMKACLVNPSFVNVSSEFGRRLKRLANEDNKDGPMSQLRTVMTALYQKSGATSMVGGISYSNKENNMQTVTGVAYSMIGETTPGAFYDSLTSSMMEDGFLSRFIIIDYAGERPATNRNVVTEMHPALAQALHGLCAQSLTLLSRYKSEMVQYDPAAKQALDEFDKLCDQNINKTTDESYRQMWNRAHLKVCRLAALLAVADNWLQPVVTTVHTDWALSVIRRDIELMSHRMESGDVGTDDAARERKMVATLRDYLRGGKPSLAYGIPDGMPLEGIVTHRYIQMRLCRVSQFLIGKAGSTYYIQSAIRSLIDSGVLVELDKQQIFDRYHYSGKCYRIVDLPPLD